MISGKVAKIFSRWSVRSSRAGLSVFFFMLLSCCFIPCFSEGASQPDYRGKTQSLSKDIHGTLDELREQQTLLQTQLQIVENDLKSSQGRVKELETELTALIISSENTNARLADYSTKLTVSDSKLRFWRRTAVIGWGILLCLIAAFVMKKLGFLAKFI